VVKKYEVVVLETESSGFFIHPHADHGLLQMEPVEPLKSEKMG
jgi:hypothetical protein